MKNKAAEKEMRAHIRDVKKARGELKSDAHKLEGKIGKKITGALKQDARVMKDMKKADKRG